METLVSISIDTASKTVTSFADNNLVVRIDSITRISFAVENE